NGWEADRALTSQGGLGCSHSLRYFYTGVSEPGAGLPSFLAVGYVDDVAFIHYDSETQTARPQPQAPWMEGKVEAQYWERETRNLRNVQARYKVSLQTLIQRYNRSGGESLHTYQNTYGCNLLANGSTWGIDQFAFDGNDFISFDKNTLTWVAADPGAQVTKRKWGDSDIQYRKRYQEQTCVEWLRKYLEHGKETLQRRERPAVRVTGRDAPGGPTTLSCRAHGFYPRDIALSWLRKGESSEQKTWRGGVLPNGDGTYHAWATVEIDPRERDLYSCRVEHESLAQPLDTAWGEAGVCVDTSMGRRLPHALPQGALQSPAGGGSPLQGGCRSRQQGLWGWGCGWGEAAGGEGSLYLTPYMNWDRSGAECDPPTAELGWDPDTKTLRS
uniref:Ig-like domain-containing protein n=1 Tax=Chrysemys picta bellii TaxID=8478 RepID=A0A8C3HEG2_CHRPI